MPKCLITSYFGLLSLSLFIIGPTANAEWLQARDKIVKIYGSGGMQGLEAYQTGILTSAEGHILTVDSLVLDQGDVTVITAAGNRYAGEVLGADPTLEIAMIKIDPAGDRLPSYVLRGNGETSQPGQPIYALANIFGIATGDEPVSAMRGVIAAIAPLKTAGGPSVMNSTYGLDGQQVYILDAVTSNPGAAGGALVDHRGRLLGMLGPERMSRTTGTWISYAIPMETLAPATDRIIAGEKQATSQLSHSVKPPVDTLSKFGFRLLPEIVNRTPPYVDYVRPDSSAKQAGLQADDLIIFANDLTIASTAALRRVLNKHENSQPLQLLVEREGEFLEITVEPEGR